MPGHEVYLHLGLLDAVPKSGPQRRKIMDFVRSLRERPDTRGDFTDKDSTLRERQIKVVGDYAITFWLDAPVKIVMVVDIRPADK
jgi:hypothetical protein